MRTRFKIGITVGLILIALYAYSWLSWLLNLPSNLAVIAGYFGFATLFVVGPTIIYQLWKPKKEKENAQQKKRGEKQSH